MLGEEHSSTPPRPWPARWVELLARGGRIGLATSGDDHPVWARLDELFAP